MTAAMETVTAVGLSTTVSRSQSRVPMDTAYFAYSNTVRYKMVFVPGERNLKEGRTLDGLLEMLVETRVLRKRK